MIVSFRDDWLRDFFVEDAGEETGVYLDNHNYR